MRDIELGLGPKVHAHQTSLGDVILREHVDEHGRVTAVEVLHADPRVLISGALLRAIHDDHSAGLGLPVAEVDHLGVGGTLKIRATNQTLIYRMTEYEPLLDGYRVQNTYVGEWPD